ncbi:DNA gyrase subunit A [Patescibacteria group bacterium]|nr:MAG: DNA gyrase subunit A [Patescibacteria group bacterium]
MVNFGKINPRKITTEMEQSYLDYAMSVIVARALPDVRDGLKPVHRRILYAMHGLGLKHSAKFRKSATVVGEVLGKYHPHGDLAVYESLVRMAQPFAMRYPLVNGQGNFGSMDGDRAAAMRYTEVKMEQITKELLLDIGKETVDFIPNYDETRKEPKVLPAKLPQLLLNGTMGIAVGMATNIPPHNLTEVVDSIIYLIDNSEASVQDLLQFVKGPDFPTGGIIYNQKDIESAYATGKGKIIVRGKAIIEETKKDRFRIIISEVPYQVNKAEMLAKIANLVKEKKIVGIGDLRDESDKEGVRVVLDLKNGAFPNKILNQLYKHTNLQSSFHLNMLALIGGIQPKVLDLKMILEEYLKHRKEVVTRRIRYKLKKAKERLHILEGLKIALDNLDAVIKTIRSSRTKEEAHLNLIKKFKLSDKQSEAILEMKLQSLAALERQKVEDEYKEKKKLIKTFEEILKSPKRILGIIKKELLDLKEEYGGERRTKVVKGPIGRFEEEDLVANEPMIVTLTRGGYIKRLAPSVYKSQKRGGKGVKGMTTKEEDIVEHLLLADAHSDLLFFSNTGKVFQSKVYEIPETGRTAKGQSVMNFLQLGMDEKITAVVSPRKEDNVKYIFMITSRGIVKKVAKKDFEHVRRSGLIAIKLRQDDHLGWVCGTDDDSEVILATANGQAIRFKEKQVRAMGRNATGVKGIKLKKDDLVISARRVRDPKGDLLVITENGFGKRTELSKYKIQSRGGSGLKTVKVTERNGKLVAMRIVVSEEADLIAISEKGQIIRLPVKGISKQGRATQGVRLMRMKGEDKIASVTLVG